MRKSQSFEIPKKIHESITVQVDKSPELYNKLHQHEEIQISYIKKGAGKLIIADSIHAFKKGAIFCIGSNNPHLFKSNDTTNSIYMISIFFTKKSFEDALSALPELAQMKLFFSKTEVNLKVISNTRLVQQLMNKLFNANKFSRFILFLSVIQQILNADTIALSEFKYHKKISDVEGKRMQQIFDYVMKNFQNTISLKDVAGRIYMTPNAFCRFFKQRTNKTFFQFLIQLRVEHACQMLENEADLSIEAIALGSGFNSVSNFNRQFKSLKKMSPSYYSKTLL